MRFLIPYLLAIHVLQLASVSLLVSIFVRRHNPAKCVTPLFLFTAAYFLVDFITTISTIFHIRNISLTYIYYPSEYIFISWIFFTICPRHHKRLIILFGAIALPVFLLGLIYLRGATGHNFIGMSFLHITILIIAGRYLVWLTAKGQTELKSDPQFYITLGIILDCGITAISFILFDTFEYRMPYFFNAISDAVSSIFVFTGTLFLYKNEMAVLKTLRQAEQESPTT